MKLANLINGQSQDLRECELRVRHNYYERKEHKVGGTLLEDAM